MATYRKPTALTLSVAAAITTLTGVAAATPSPSAAPAEASIPALDWRDCAKPDGPPTQQCATLEVPLDYSDPGGETVSLAVSRVRSADPGQRRGTLLVVPGGPGASGVQRLEQKAEVLREQVGDAYDLVGFDPRGTGSSTRAACGLPAEDLYLTSLRSWPDADGGIEGSTERSRRIAELCARNGGAVLRSMSSVNEARDIDRLRQALGERKLSIWSTSYGTYVTAVYAQKFPQHTDRVVMDSVQDPDPHLVGRGWLANTSRAVEDRFPDFANWAADPARESSGLRLGQRPEDVRTLVVDLMAALDREPKDTTHPILKLTGNGLRQSLLDALYDDKRFTDLAKLVKAAQDPDGVPVLGPALTHLLEDADAAVSIAVVCNDVRWPEPGSSAGYEQAVAVDRALYPLTGGMPKNITPCTFWQNDQREKPTRITSDGPSNILLIQNRRDPATPHFAASEMRRALGDRARMVTVERGGHGVYLGTGNACGDRAVTTFLTTGERPTGDVSCSS
ncbi:alpha/beta hydrolase [Streptomyces sp. NPDC056716]|uniref:alpha/beta hydrolase n=1 Tax=unclassified Streptomyces TaxID=2593676 RepID=UPI0036BCD7D1